MSKHPMLLALGKSHQRSIQTLELALYTIVSFPSRLCQITNHPLVCSGLDLDLQAMFNQHGKVQLSQVDPAILIKFACAFN